MGSAQPKVLLPLLGRPMLQYVVAAMRGAGLQRIVVVIGKGESLVRSAFRGAGLEFSVQRDRLGTAHAAQEALPLLAGHRGDVVIAPGDAPLLSAEAIRSMLLRHRKTGARLTVMAAAIPDPTGLGRVLRGRGGEAVRIAEDPDAAGEERRISEVNVGVYCIAVPLLAELLPLIGNDNSKGEYYLTDMVELLSQRKVRVAVHLAEPPPWPVGVNTPAQLEMAEQALRHREAGAVEPTVSSANSTRGSRLASQNRESVIGDRKS
jgi:bifunctional UDP-N-acetylglucosamine pyrophosphorylase/glucosamine-1-phosphate N-acetyltransferase